MKKRKKNILTTLLPKTYKTLALRGGRSLSRYKISWFRQHIWKPSYRRYFKKLGTLIKARWEEHRQLAQRRHKVSDDDFGLRRTMYFLSVVGLPG